MTEQEELEKSFQKGFIHHNHFEVVEIEKGHKAVIKVSLTEKSLNPYGFAHGGLIFGLGDTAMGLAARSTGRNAVTLSANISYLKPSMGKKLVAVAEIIKSGKTTCYLRCDFFDEKKSLTATMDANYYFVN